MKYLKLSVLALGCMLMASCSDKTEYNTASDVTVQMGEPTASVGENMGIVEIPIVLSGTANGPVKVTVKVEGTGSVPAEPYEANPEGVWSGNFVLSSETINIPEGVSTVNVQFNMIDDLETTGDREMTVTIASCEGAAIGDNKSTVVTVKDNEMLPIYELVQGAYTLSYVDHSGAAKSAPVMITGFAEGSQEYRENKLMLSGIFEDYVEGASTTIIKVSENRLTKKVTFTLELPQAIGAYDSSYKVWIIGATMQGFSLGSMTYSATFDRPTQTITFTPSAMWGMLVANGDLSDVDGLYAYISDVVLKR